MKAYLAKDIRNICLLGRGGAGKTSLAEALLYLTNGTDRLGKIPEGNTILDYDPEEIKRQLSVSLAVAPVEYKNTKINIIDTPGYFDFAGEVAQGARVCDCGLVVVHAKSGVGVSTEKAWNMLAQYKRPLMFYISKIEEENGDYFKVVDELRAKFGMAVCPLIIPVMDGTKIKCLVDVANNKAYATQNFKTIEVPVPDEVKAKLEEYRSALLENVAEASEEFMEKFFAGEEFSAEEIAAGLKAGIVSRSVFPVLCGSNITLDGVQLLLDVFVDYAPPADSASAQKAFDSLDNEVEVKFEQQAETCLFVFKTVIDQYGKFSIFKVMAGSVKPEDSLINARVGTSEKMGRLFVIKGKKNTEVDVLNAGDIGAVAKLAETLTGDTLCSSKRVVGLLGIDYPKPTYSQAVTVKVKGAEEKISSGLARLLEEDKTLRSEINSETKQHIISGLGDMHLDVVCGKLKSKFGVDIMLEAPKVPYRETIKKKVKVEGKHKKQSGGHGQYGHVWIEFEPNPNSTELVFEEKIFGGSVPKNFHPAVEKGLRDCITHGVLAGYPVVNLKATLVDGSYHDVDSSEMAFKIAAGLAYKAGLVIANPVLLEPISNLKVYVPDYYTGDIIGDINKRRGQILGMTPASDGLTEIEAEVPAAEMAAYTIDLKSMTQGRGTFKLTFNRYQEAPPNVAAKVIAESKKDMEEAE